ncbi:hypothetical protein FANTH_13152 [Fusarium anthophilum]|uniref:Inheritance of peroxisomes protein 1 n=1 Tax=Fusarium anthophilum TaxID=48485 RepID=A0A8H4YPR2_9HYPO|nr:hypothetical protein FANTH_13152 [Fusarium anthophilum]
MDDSGDDLAARGPRRVSTAPMPSRGPTEPETPDSDLVETLYSHPNVKIISFTATGRAYARSPGGPALSNVDPPSSLSWSSQLERTIAVGPFRIYRAPRSVAFLSCGSALQPILRKSQCWCIDEVNKLPVDDPEDQQRAEELREVLDKILQFEKTECPFKRTFTVDLPEQVPVTILPWTPRAQPMTPSEEATPASSTDSRRSSFVGRASTPTPLIPRHPRDIPTSPIPTRPESAASSVVPSNISLYEEYGMNLDPLQPLGTGNAGTGPLEAVPERPGEQGSPDMLESHDRSSVLSSSPTEDDSSVYQLHEGSGNRGGNMKARLRRRTGNFTTRSATMPPHMMPTLDKSTPSASTSREPLSRSVSETTRKPTGRNADTTSSPQKKNKGDVKASQSPQQKVNAQQPRLLRRDSEESFHSVESWHSSGAPQHPSPPTSQAESSMEANNDPGGSPMPCAWESDSDDDSETSDESSSSDADSVRELKNDAFPKLDAIPSTTATTAPQRPFVPRHRATTGSISVRRRALSPLPPAANLFTPASTMERRPYRSKLETVKNLPMAIIAKTYEMILGPPSSLIRLILKVAAKIASGQWRGLVYGYGEDGEEIPVQWDYSEGEFSDWSDDEHDRHDRGHKQGKREHRHSRHRSNAQDMTAEDEMRRRPSSSDDSRSWGVD